MPLIYHTCACGFIVPCGPMLVAEEQCLLRHQLPTPTPTSPAFTTAYDPCQQRPVHGHQIAYDGKDNKTPVQARCQRLPPFK
jgi:hypothetical protein